MDWRLVAIVPFVLVGLSAGLANTRNNLSMIEEINRSPDKRKSFSPYGWWAGKVFAVRDEHARLFPESKRRERQVALNVIFLISLAIAGATILFTLTVNSRPRDDSVLLVNHGSEVR